MKTHLHRAPAALMSLAVLLAMAVPLAAQLTPQQDPANLAGERVSAPDLADTLPIDHGALALEQLLRKLRTRASLMLIVAHPDDEDGGLLTYLSRGQGARVAMLTLTRGEGGQNLMSADFDDALGLIRTQELLAADRYMGVDQFFGTEVDFGFSKTKEESFAKWTHDRVLYDAVRSVRLYRPLVVAAVFIGAASDGHGQHQVSGQIAQEVFNAAGDPNVFPDQIAAGLQPWQPLKVYARVPFARIDEHGMFDYATNQYAPSRFTNYVTGKVTSIVPKANVVVHEGDTDPLLGGLSYVQFAREGLALEKSQIGPNARLAGPGPHDVSYHRYGSKLNQPDGDDSGLEPSLFDGIDTSLPGIATLAPDVAGKFRPLLEKIDQQIAEAQHLFDPAKPELTAPPLRLALSAVDSFLHELEDPNVNDLPPAETYNLLHELHIKRVQLNDALILAHGLTLEATLADSTLLTTQNTVQVNLGTSFGGNDTDRVHIDSVELVASDGSKISHPPETGDVFKHVANRPVLKLGLPQGLTATRPYFSRPDIEQPYYDVGDANLRDAPATPAPITASVTLNDNGTPFTLTAIVANMPVQLLGGDSMRKPAVVVPPISIAMNRQVEVLPSAKAQISVGFSISPPSAQIDWADLARPVGWKTVSDGATRPGFEDWVMSVPPSDRQPKLLQASVIAREGTIYKEGYRAVGYPGLVYTNYYTPAITRVVPVEVHTAPNLNIAYLPGTGDDVPSALDQLGVHPHLIKVSDLTAEGLEAYDAVVLGVRPYEAHRDLAAANPALNAYAAAGGIVICQYDTGRLPEGTGPYPLDLGDSEKVVEEDAPVRILAPADPLLNWPNKITAGDFDHWVEERGHGFMGSWDPHYTPLLETHDPGQQPQRGGLLVARTGKGAWIYLGLALYRQLPEGVPGAYRLLANLISSAKDPALK